MENYKNIHLHLHAHINTTFKHRVTEELEFFPELIFFNLLQLYFQFFIYGGIIEC